MKLHALRVDGNLMRCRDRAVLLLALVYLVCIICVCAFGFRDFVALDEAFPPQSTARVTDGCDSHKLLACRPSVFVSKAVVVCKMPLDLNGSCSLPQKYPSESRKDQLLVDTVVRWHLAFLQADDLGGNDSPSWKPYAGNREIAPNISCRSNARVFQPESDNEVSISDGSLQRKTRLNARSLIAFGYLSSEISGTSSRISGLSDEGGLILNLAESLIHRDPLLFRPVDRETQKNKCTYGYQGSDVAYNSEVPIRPHANINWPIIDVYGSAFGYFVLCVGGSLCFDSANKRYDVKALYASNIIYGCFLFAVALIFATHFWLVLVKVIGLT